jgi:hypothetical protein
MPVWAMRGGATLDYEGRGRRGAGGGSTLSVRAGGLWYVDVDAVKVGGGGRRAVGQTTPEAVGVCSSCPPWWSLRGRCRVRVRALLDWLLLGALRNLGLLPKWDAVSSAGCVDVGFARDPKSSITPTSPRASPCGSSVERQAREPPQESPPEHFPGNQFSSASCAD